MVITKKNDSIAVSMKLENTGDYKGDEVVQLYVKDVKSSGQRPLKQLLAFERISLKIGESKIIRFQVPVQQLMFWDEKCREWHFEKGDFEFMIGASLSDIRLKKTFKIKK
ncbi:fibronectin type III-like domain-contianing protein [Labilibaculum sp.]|uniref:fibronectin type III-like domain-contianing protein n=1 Tax=Labilibaculum sp. TaxID=2060723 RepID=UPI0035632A8E